MGQADVDIVPMDVRILFKSLVKQYSLLLDKVGASSEFLYSNVTVV